LNVRPSRDLPASPVPEVSSEAMVADIAINIQSSLPHHLTPAG
jgi:hypothetical protein